MSSEEGVFGDGGNVEDRGTTLVLHFRVEVVDKLGKEVKGRGT